MYNNTNVLPSVPPGFKELKEVDSDAAGKSDNHDCDLTGEDVYVLLQLSYWATESVFISL